jgi:hypothetical protein
VLQPNGGEIWTAGDSASVSWTADEPCGEHVRIHLIRNGDSCMVVADSVLSSTGDCAWLVAPCNEESTGYAVRVTDLLTSKYDDSDSTFTIRAAPAACNLALTYPNGGEYLIPGSAVDISWESDSCAATVAIELLRDGLVCEPIATGAPNSGIYNWTVSQCGTQTDGYTIRITDSENEVQDESDGVFSVTTDIPLSYVLATAQPGTANGYQFERLVDLDPNVRYYGGALIDIDTCIRGHGALIDLYYENVRILVNEQHQPTRCDVDHCIIINGATTDLYGGALEYRPDCYGWVFNNTFFENPASGVYMYRVRLDEPGMRVFHNIFANGGVCGAVRNDNQPSVEIRHNCSYAHGGDMNYCDHCGCPSDPTPHPILPEEAGTGNMDDDPLFVNPKSRDLRLQQWSPCRGAGENDEDLGALPYEAVSR